MTRDELLTKYQNTITGIIVNTYAEVWRIIETRSNQAEARLLDASRSGELLVKLIADARKLVASIIDDATTVPNKPAPEPPKAAGPAPTQRR